MKSRASIFPEAVQVSYGEACRLNFWALIAVVVAAGTRVLLRGGEDWSWWMKAGLALAPLVPGLLYLRTLWRWSRHLDEMQRRLQLEAACFGAMMMLMVAAAVDLLRGAGVASGIGLGWEGYFAGTFVLYLWGLARANRVYR